MSIGAAIMFDELTRMLRNLNGQQVSVPLTDQTDADGYIDKECPSAECQFGFKIHADDWRNIVRDEEVFCPACGHAAPAKSWFTTEQVEWVKEAAFNQVKQEFGQAMRRDAQAWNRRQRPGGFISITLQVKDHPEPLQLPLSATDPMRLKITCAKCRCRYSVIGSAYFCPSCGHNAADKVFHQSLDKIRASIDIAPTLRTSILDKDMAENTIRSLVEGGLQSGVTAFQRFVEAMYGEMPVAPKARRNAFQSLDEGSRLWSQVTGSPYNQYLADLEIRRLARYFQMRHLLAHRDGLVDADYVLKSNDSSYREGQRLVITPDAVKDCLDLVEKLCIGLKSSLQV